MIRYWLNGVLVGVDDRRAKHEKAVAEAAMLEANPECTFDVDAFFRKTDNLALP